jgi:hypothetical protein
LIANNDDARCNADANLSLVSVGTFSAPTALIIQLFDGFGQSFVRRFVSRDVLRTKEAIKWRRQIKLVD